MPSKKTFAGLHFMDGLLAFVPIAIALYYLGAPVLLTFIFAAIAIAGLSHVIVEATGIIARRVSNTISALLNATFGNAARAARLGHSTFPTGFVIL
jgi:Ca2+:H+ antiporter